MATVLERVDPSAVLVALALMGLDIVLGIAGAVKEKDVQSSKMREGLWHKCGSIGLIVLAFALEYAVNRVDLGVVFPGVVIVCAYICLMEVGSCLENLVVLNPQLADNPIMRVFSSKEERGGGPAATMGGSNA